MSTYFSNQLGPPDAWNQFPSLNFTPTHELVDGQIVRFRCMIQDIFDPEYYLSTFEIKDLSTGQTRLETGKYRDLTPCGPREELNPDSAVTVNSERQSFYAITIPGKSRKINPFLSSRAANCISLPRVKFIFEFLFSYFSAENLNCYFRTGLKCHEKNQLQSILEF